MRLEASGGRPRAASVVAATAVSVTLLAWPSAAGAHSDVTGTTPTAGSVSPVPVRSVRLDFAMPVLPDLTYVVVTGGTGVAAAEPVVEGSTVTAALDTAARQGTYTVAYRTVASDGHPVSGSFSFQVVTRTDTVEDSSRPRRDETAVVTPAPSPDARPAPTERRAQDVPPTDDVPGLGVVGAGAAVLLLGGSLLRRRLASRG